MDDPPAIQPSLNQRVGSGVRAEMARAGMSQVTLARVLGISPNALRRRLLDEVSFSVREVDVICQLFDIGPHELIREAIKFESVRITACEVYVTKA